MRESIFKLLLGYIAQLTKGVAAIGFYDEVIADIEKQKKPVLETYNQFKKDIEDQEHFRSLSMPEQSALGQNEIHFRKLLREMDDAISHLMAQRWTTNVRASIWYLDDLRLCLEGILETHHDIKTLAEEVSCKDLLNEKKFETFDYSNKAAHIQTMTDVLIEEIIDEANYGGYPVDGLQLKFTCTTTLGKIRRLMQQEIEDVEANGLPDPYQFDVPDIVEPEIPEEAPEPVEEQKEIEFPEEELKE